MGMTYELKIWAFCILPAIAAASACGGNVVCKVRQLGSPQYRTSLLQCSDQSCSRATFAPSPSEVCLIQNLASSTGASTVRIYLSSCAKVATNEGYVLDGTGNVVSWKRGVASKSTLFNDTSCETLCNAIDRVVYKSRGGMLIADKDNRIGISRTASCQQAFYVYPNIIPTGACDKSVSTGLKRYYLPSRLGQAPKKQFPSRTRQRALLTLTDGESTLAVGSPERRSDGSYQLPIVEQSKGEVFYVQSYISQAIGACGTVESVTAYTLQLVSSRKYLVADELNDTTLKHTSCGSTGLSLEDASEFSAGYAQKPDNRLFIGYNVTAYNRTATFFCPLFHRKFCLFPTVGGYMRLISLRGLSDSLEPTFENPTNEELQDYLLPPNKGGETLTMALSIVQNRCT